MVSRDRDLLQLESAIYPTMLLSRSATAPLFRRIGLHTLLRSYALQKALTEPRVRSLSGAVYEGAPRLHLLRGMGYQFQPVATPDERFATALVPEFAIHLERERFAAAAAYLRGELAPLFEIYDVTGPGDERRRSGQAE